MAIIKHPNQQCDCRYLASNQTLYPYDQAFPFTDYFNYAISANNPNLLSLITSDQDVITYDLKTKQSSRQANLLAINSSMIIYMLHSYNLIYLAKLRRSILTSLGLPMFNLVAINKQLSFVIVPKIKQLFMRLIA